MNLTVAPVDVPFFSRVLFWLLALLDDTFYLSMCVVDMTSQLKSAAPELLPLWLRYGRQVPEELVRDVYLGGVRNHRRTANCTPGIKHTGILGTGSIHCSSPLHCGICLPALNLAPTAWKNVGAHIARTTAHSAHTAHTL